jgi:broad specificity phosphatase PhoE
MMHRFTFLRHGISVGNEQAILQGQLDSELVDAGIQQIHRLGQLWHGQGRSFDRIFSSPLHRAKQTAEIIAGYLDLPVMEDPVWMERHFGTGQGLPLIEYEKSLTERLPGSIYVPPFTGGESRWQLNLRAMTAIEKMVQLNPGSYLYVSHGGFLNTLIRILFGDLPRRTLPSIRIRIPNGAFLDFEFNAVNGRWTMLQLVPPPAPDASESNR